MEIVVVMNQVSANPTFDLASISLTYPEKTS